MKMFKFLSIALVAILLQLMVASNSMAAPEAQWGGGGGGGGYYHTVQYGDTLFSLGRHYGVNPYAIAEANGLWNPDYIYAGQVLYVPHDNNCGWNDCGRNNSGWDNCQDDCGWEKPDSDNCGYENCDWNNSGWDDCQNDCGWDNCGGNCGSGSGYDQAGYYYYNNSPSYDRYSYPCGYNYNCY